MLPPPDDQGTRPERGAPSADVWPGVAGAIDGFAVERLLGRGASGAVFLARQHQPDRRVALKFLLSGHIDWESAQRFEREAELLGGIAHPNIARLYDVRIAANPDSGPSYLVMEWVQGGSLTDHVARTQPDLRARVRLLVALAHAMHHVHTLGIVHRDLKPANVLVDADGTPKIVDFGVARPSAPDAFAGLTLQGRTVGTLRYMAPEQLAGTAQAADPQVDVYALGLLGVELLTGQLPYHADDFRTEIVAAETLRARPPELQVMAAGLPRDLGAVLARAVHSTTDRRYGSMLELALDLERFLANLPVRARAPGIVHATRLLVRRHRALAAACAFSVLALIAAAVQSTRSALREAEQERIVLARSAEMHDNLQLMQTLLTHDFGTRRRDPEAGTTAVLEDASRYLKDQHDMVPAVMIRAKITIGRALINMFHRDAGMAMLQEVAQQSKNLTHADPDLQADLQLSRLTDLYVREQYREAVTLGRTLQSVPPGETHKEHQRWIETHHLLAEALMEGGQSREALPVVIELEEHKRQWVPMHDPSWGETLVTRAYLELYSGHFGTLVDMAQAHIDEYAALYGEKSPVIFQLLNSASGAAREQGQYALARQWAARALRSASRRDGTYQLIARVAQGKVDYLDHLLNPADPAPVRRLRALYGSLKADVIDQRGFWLEARFKIDAIDLAHGSASARQHALADLLAFDADTRAGKYPVDTSSFRARLILAQYLQGIGSPKAADIYAPLCADLRHGLPADHPFIDRCTRGAAGAVTERQT